MIRTAPPTLLFLLSTLSAQQGASTPATPPLEALRIPLHGGTQAHEPGYGLWASGDSYKASFHDGFALYPCLGAGFPGNLPLCWRTAAVSAGGEPLPVAASPDQERSDWRIAFAHGAWTEIYELRPEGVEQMFRIERAPRTAGDLVITGRITTPLHCAPVGAAHQELRFATADGQPILTYGAAFAVDANGDKVPVATSFDGSSIALTVAGSWLAKAAFPVLVDPLTAPVVLSQQTGNLTINQVGSTDVGNDHTGNARNTVTAYTRIFSATDHDVYAIASDADFLGNRVTVFSDLSTTNSDRNVAVAFVGGAHRWMVAFERETASACTIRVLFHDQGNGSLNSGVGVSVSQPAGAAYFRNPDVGGAWIASNLGMLVYQNEFTSSTTNNNTAVVARPVDASTRTFLAAYEVGSVGVGTSLDRENPTVNPMVRGDNQQGWVIAWQELNRTTLLDDWDIVGSRINHNGAKLASATIVSGGTRHALTPQVAGDSFAGYMVTYGLSADLTSTAVTELRAQPFFWNLNDPAPGFSVPSRLITSGVPLLSSVQNRCLVMDDLIGAFYAMTYTTTRIIGLNVRVSATVVRMSVHAVVVESATLFSDATFSAVAPSVGYAYPEEHFLLTYGTNEDTGSRAHILYGRTLDYPAGAGEFRYGTACGGAVIDGHRPWAGNLYYRMGMSLATPNAPTILFVGANSGAIPLDGAGMTGCTFLIDPTFFLVLSGVTDPQGYGSLGFPLPDEPLLTGDLYFQYLYLAPLANPASLVATQGLRSQVRS